MTPGQIFWVAPAASYTVDGESYTASDSNDGLSPTRAVLTVDYAVGLTTASVGDVIVLLPGAHSSAATVTLDVAGITVTGLPGPGSHAKHANSGPPRNRCSITNTATAGFIFTVSADDVEIAHLDLIPVTAGGRGIYAQAGADRMFIHDCTFSMIAASATSTYGIALGTVATGAIEDMVVRNCRFISGVAGTASSANGAGVVAIATAYGLTIEQCTFTHKGTDAWARAIESLSAGTTNMLVRDCDFLNSSTAASEGIGTCVHGGGSTIDGAIQVYRCYVSAGSDTATATAITDIVLAETYLASAGGGALANNN